MTDHARDFEAMLATMRPKLYRYCARMTGSAVDGEDIVQDARIKAIDALPAVGSLDNPEGWLFRIAHNAALDFLRRNAAHAPQLTRVLRSAMTHTCPPVDEPFWTTLSAAKPKPAVFDCSDQEGRPRSPGAKRAQDMNQTFRTVSDVGTQGTICRKGRFFA